MQLSFRDLNLVPYSPYLTSIYTCGIIILPKAKVCGGVKKFVN